MLSHLPPAYLFRVITSASNCWRKIVRKVIRERKQLVQQKEMIKFSCFPQFHTEKRNKLTRLLPVPLAPSRDFAKRKSSFQAERRKGWERITDPVATEAAYPWVHEMKPVGFTKCGSEDTPSSRTRMMRSISLGSPVSALTPFKQRTVELQKDQRWGKSRWSQTQISFPRSFY